MKDWLVAFAVMAALFIVPMSLIGYPVMSGREFELDWMIGVGLLLCPPATAAFLWFCLARKSG